MPVCMKSVNGMEPGYMAGSNTDNLSTLAYLSPHTNWRFSNSHDFFQNFSIRTSDTRSIVHFEALEQTLRLRLVSGLVDK